MKERPEALVGGPPTSLSEGPALSAFRLRPPGRDATPAPSEDVPSPLTPSPCLPSKGLSAAAEPTVVLPQWGCPSWIRVGAGQEEEEKRHGVLSPCVLVSA